MQISIQTRSVEVKTVNKTVIDNSLDKINTLLIFRPRRLHSCKHFAPVLFLIT
jgi:hypothetical protein